MTTEQQLRQLEARVDDLLRISARLRQENQSLHEREAKLVEERAQLLKKTMWLATRSKPLFRV
ncbi:TIGR02449 family protein [Alcanivorax sp. IL1]|uniref:TIGR02449 family protein n=1 Tax=Alcanivorax sp. IL1 TaxID=3396308 RepID=UPI0039C08F92